MKKLLAAAALVCFYSTAEAAPYFRSIISKDANGHIAFNKPAPVLGALIDPGHLGNSEAASLLPLITHSPKDGCLMPSIVCEDWTPLAVGVSANAGKFTLDVAPLANVLPWMQRGVLAVVPDKWAGFRNLLAPSTDAPVTFSAGPVWQYRQANNKGYFRVFTGLALHF